MKELEKFRASNLQHPRMDVTLRVCFECKEEFVHGETVMADKNHPEYIFHERCAPGLKYQIWTRNDENQR